jgi:SulP family sulfate permease
MSERRGATKWLGALGAGAAVGAVETVLAVAFAALVFNGLIGDAISDGIALYLTGAFAMLAVMAWRVGGRGIVGTPQEVSAAVVGLVAMSTSLDAFGGPERSFVTAVLATLHVTVLAGVALFLLGALRRGNLVRFIPVPVVGAFVAGAGWLLIRGGLAVTLGESPFLLPLSELTDRDGIVKWVPALAFGVILLVAFRITKRQWTIPIGLALGVVAFAFGLVVSGHTWQDARSYGWLVLGPFDDPHVWEAWTARAVTGGDVASILRQSLGLLTAVFVTVLAVFHAIGGTERVVDRDLDTNRELRDAGLANVAAGALGGIPGFHSIARTTLIRRSRVDARIAGFVAALVPLVAVGVGDAIVAKLPRAVLGGVLIFLGLSAVVEWVWDRRHELSRVEVVVVLVILLIVVARGFMAGIAVGLVSSVVLFAISYGGVEQVRRLAFASAYRSRVDRPPSEREAIERSSHRVEVLRLNGFVFFGSANALLERVRARGDADGLRFVVLDLRRVSGVDSSAVASFVKIAGLARSHGSELVLAGASVPVRAQLARGGVTAKDGAVTFAVDLDHGLQRCEDALLAAEQPASDAVAEGRAEMPLRLADHLRREEVPEGTVLIQQGASPGDVFVLESGRLVVATEMPGGMRVRLGTIRPGVVVGEVAMYTGVPRMADVYADTPVVVLRLTRDALARIEVEQPDLAAEVHRWLAEQLAERLADTQRTVGALIG